MPTNALYYVTRVVGTRKFSSDVKELKQAVDSLSDINEQLSPYVSKEWIFDSATGVQMNQQLTGDEILKFGFNVKEIAWKKYAQNHGYGIKRFILKEEAVLPSEGFHDYVSHMQSSNSGLASWLPWNKK